jgi:hypothetical protein
MKKECSETKLGYKTRKKKKLNEKTENYKAGGMKQGPNKVKKNKGKTRLRSSSNMVRNWYTYRTEDHHVKNML